MLGIGSAERSWVDVKKSDQESDQLLAVAYLRRRVLCIHLLVLKKQGLKVLYLTQISKMVHTVAVGMISTTPSTIN